MITSWKVVGCAKWAAKLLLTEMFVPGGTLVVLALLLAGRSPQLSARRFVALVPFRRERRPAPGDGVIADSALRRAE